MCNISSWWPSSQRRWPSRNAAWHHCWNDDAEEYDPVPNRDILSKVDLYQHVLAVLLEGLNVWHIHRNYNVQNVQHVFTTECDPCLAGNEWQTGDDRWKLNVEIFIRGNPHQTKYQKWNVTDFSLIFHKTRKILEYLCTDSLIHRRMFRNHVAELTGAGKKDWGQEALYLCICIHVFTYRERVFVV